MRKIKDDYLTKKLRKKGLNKTIDLRRIVNRVEPKNCTHYTTFNQGCTHRDNSDFRSKLNRRYLKRCLIKFCPLKR